ncbi:hypothetical protein B0H11DRAFT_1907342 [Mycena galericulata]|nr:hypothetical protein B0H11DRAFT_1907342 [Mycena galericulata]
MALRAQWPMTDPLILVEVELITEFSSEMLANITKAGFINKVNEGIKDTGFLLLAKDRSGGHVFDVGSWDLIINGRIKIKSDSLIKESISDGVVFEKGSKVNADVIIFATGYSDAVEHIRSICGDSVAKKCKTLWGLDSEGEIQGVWRDTGIKNLCYMAATYIQQNFPLSLAIGSLALDRFHSKHLALQIKAIEE